MIALAGLARAQGTAKSEADAEIEKEILKVEHEKDQAMQNRDLAVLNRIYADDLTFVNARGQVLTKAQRMEEIRAGNVKYLSFDKSDNPFAYLRTHGCSSGS